MGRMRRRRRRGGNGNGYLAEPSRPMETFNPAYVPVASDRPPAAAPVLELDGLDPWTEIQGPNLALEEGPAADGAMLACDDPAQLTLDPADATSALDASDCRGGVAMLDEPAPPPDASVGPDGRTGAADAAEASAADASEAEPVVAPEPEPIAAAREPVPPPPDPIDLRYDEARCAAEAGRCAEARSLYRQILAARPTHVRARNNLALLLDAEGNHQGALAEFDRALEVDPENGTLLVNRGALLGAMGRYAAAERDLKKVLRVEPSNAEALFHLGVVMTKKGLWGEAIPNLRRVVELEPERGAAYYWLGEALNHVDDLGGALASYQRAAELQPGNPRALYGLGIIYDRLARPDDAAHMYRRAREAGRR